MRLSSWRSDVCSSDLKRRAHRVDGGRAAPFRRRRDLAEEGMRSGRAPCLANTDAHAGEQELNKVLCEAAGSGETAPNDHGKAQYTDPIAALRPEIGRASSRERVCQYVKISVGAVTLKKQKKQAK